MSSSTSSPAPAEATATPVRRSTSTSLAGRFASLFAKKEDPTPTQKDASQVPTPSTPTQQNEAPNEAEAPLSPASPRTPTPAATISSNGKSLPTSNGFFSGLKAKALNSFAAHRAEAAERAAFKASGLEKVNSRMFLLHLPEDEATSSSSASSNSTNLANSKARSQFAGLAAYLAQYHDGRYLVLDVSGTLAHHDCPDDFFASSRLSLEFGSGGGSSTIGPLDRAARISDAARRWWAAEEEIGSDSSLVLAQLPRPNIVVLACDGATPRHILATCVLYSCLAFTDILQAYHSVLLTSENRLMASLHARSLPPAQKKFLHEYALVHKYDRQFHSPKVWLHELRIHKCPAFDEGEGGTRLLLVLIANRTQFLYTSQAQGGGHVWIPTTREDPLTVVVPLAVEFAGEVSIKIWHLPEHSSVDNPRRLLLETKVHSAVLCLPCWRIPEGGNGNAASLSLVAPPASSSLVPPLPPPPHADVNANANVNAPVNANVNATVAANVAVVGVASSSPPYPLHRFFVRKDFLDLNSSDTLPDSPSIMPSDIEYHKNFRLSLTATPLEEVKYRRVDESTPATATPQRSSTASSSVVASVTSPDLHQLAAQWGVPAPSTTEELTTSGEEEEQLDASSAAPAAPASPSSSSARSSRSASSIDAPVLTPTKLPSRTPANSIADGAASLAAAVHASSDSLAVPTPARRKRTSSFADDELEVPSSIATVATVSSTPFVAPVIPVPPEARTTAGIRYYAEDKQGLERPATAIELERRAAAAEERAQLNALYGPGNWRRQHGILYTLQDVEPPPGMAHILAAQQAHMEAQIRQAHAQHRHHHHSSQAAAELARQQQQLRALQAEAQAQAQAAAHSDVAAAQAIINDPNASVEAKDEAMARILAAQYAMEDAQIEAQQQQQQQQQQQPPQQSAQTQRTPSSSRRHRSSRSHRSRSSPSSPAHAESAAAVDSAATVATVSTATPPASLVTVGEDGSITLTPSATASASPSLSDPSAVNGGVAASGDAVVDDEALARAMQLQFDREDAARAVAAQAAAQAAATARAEVQARDAQQRQLEHLLRNVGLPAASSSSTSSRGGGRASHRSVLRGGASEEEIRLLPEFRLELTSKYLEEECQICREQFLANDRLRQMQCMHAYHCECLDPWLRTNRVCPVCKVPLQLH